jgi:nitronate monooxygenase
MPSESLSLQSSVRDRANSFCRRFGLRIPILEAPMAGACPVELAAAVANAGGMGAMGALMTQPQGILEWASAFRKQSNGSFQLNVWIPDPAPQRNDGQEAKVCEFLAAWGDPVLPQAGDARPPDFAKQCEAFLEISPPVISSIMGLYPREFVEECKRRHIAWFACVTTLDEARAAHDAGADALVAQGTEAGGHRGSFDAAKAERQSGTLFTLLPRIADKISDLPLIASGGIGDARAVAAALILGASAVQIGTALLRSPEAKTHPAWANALIELEPENTIATRAFTGRLGRAVATQYALAATGPEAPRPAPYPVQRGLTANMREAGAKLNDVNRMQAWAGQAAAFAKNEPAGQLIRRLWTGAEALLR